jgi:hypothetical protein
MRLQRRQLPLMRLQLMRLPLMRLQLMRLPKARLLLMPMDITETTDTTTVPRRPHAIATRARMASLSGVMHVAPAGSLASRLLITKPIWLLSQHPQLMKALPTKQR